MNKQSAGRTAAGIWRGRSSNGKPGSAHMINVSEGTRGKEVHQAYGLNIAVALQEGETPESDFEEIHETLTDWQQTRGQACHDLTLAYDAEEEQWDEIVQFWLHIMETDPFVGSFCLQLGEVTLELVTPDGLRSQELSLTVTEEGGQKDAA